LASDLANPIAGAWREGTQKSARQESSRGKSRFPLALTDLGSASAGGATGEFSSDKGQMTMDWVQRIKGLFRRPADDSALTVQNDRFGYAIQDKPRFLLRPWFEKLIAKTSMPDDQQKNLDDLAKRGTIVYALKYRSHLDFVYLSLRLHQLGLPAPNLVFDLHPYAWQPRWYALKIILYHLYCTLKTWQRPNPYAHNYYHDKLRANATGLFFLLGEEGYYQRTVLVGDDAMQHLFKTQKELDRPIFVVPSVLLYTRDPGRERRGFMEIFLGQRDHPGPIRKLVSFFRGYASAVLEIGEPLNLQEILPELSDNGYEQRKQVFQLRRELIDSVDEIKRAIVGPTIKSKLELKEIILHHPRLESFMQRRARSANQELWKVHREADGYLDEIAADYSHTMIQIGEKILSWLWTALFDGIEVDMESLQKVRQAARLHTLVYIPCHKSHIDYLVLNDVLYRNNLYSPFIAAGKNLSFWPLGPMFRRCGAFFIRRTFKGARFYAEVFSLYIKTMVQLGHNIEFFIEGGRSRTGKMVLPKMGLLAILIQAVEDGFCDDLVFVPTSLCYDRIPEEESYLKEITGGAKVDENLGQLFRARRFLKKSYGRVYVQFAEPVSLQRYLESRHQDIARLRPRDRHAMYRDFAYRIINSINQASLVTPHALVASALLTTSNLGISMPEFQAICKTFYDYLTVREVRLSKTLKNYQVVIDDTLRDLEKSKLIGKLRDDDDDLEEEVFSLEDDKRLTLEYYKNNIIHYLLPAAFVSTSILAQQTFRFSLRQLLEDVAWMKKFFKFEFVYDNELSNEKMVADVLEAFEGMGLVVGMEQGGPDQPYILSHRGLRAAQSFHNLLRNYFEGYWLVLRAFRYLHKKSYTEKDFTKKILALGQKVLKLELIERPECLSKIIFGNALKCYVEQGLLERKLDKENGDDQGTELYSDTGNRGLVQDYSRQISRFLRAAHFALH
jgi:glycerol-3-phosphate O-acyltransferase